MKSNNDMYYLGERAEDALQWEDWVSHKDWFEKEIVLSDGVERGTFRVDTAPHTEEILEDADKTHIRMMALMFASQTAKTTVSIGILFKNIATGYDNGFIMFPTAASLPRLIQFKFRPQLKGCEVLNNRITDYAQQEGDRKNSFIYNTGRNIMAVLSTVSTKSITARYGVYDECAEMDMATINEADERFKTYSTIGYKSIRSSTQIHRFDAINESFNSAEVKKRRFFICPSCAEAFYPMPEHFNFKSLNEYMEERGYEETHHVPKFEIMSDYVPFASKDPYLECPHCKHRITDEDRVNLILDKKLAWKQVVATQITEEDDINYMIVPEDEVKSYYESVGYDINTMCIHNVPMKEFVRKTIECQYAEPHERDVLFGKFYIGYWNLIYTPKSTTVLRKDDILLTSTGLADRIVPLNTSALHLGVDLQKDRLYYKLNAFAYGDGIILKTVEYGELYSNGVGNDFKSLSEIIEDTYLDTDGNSYKITSVGIDIRGFSLEDKDSRSNEALNYIFDYALKLKQYGVIDWDRFIFPMMGEHKLEARFEVQGYKVRARKRASGNNDDITINDLVFSNMRIKTILFSMLERSIDKAKSQHGELANGYDRMLYHVNEEAVRQFDERQKLSNVDRRDKHSLESHLSSEHLTYKILSNGKPAKEQTYEKKYSGIRNDWLDCDCMTIAQSFLLDTYRTPTPTEEKLDKNTMFMRLKDAIMSTI